MKEVQARAIFDIDQEFEELELDKDYQKYKNDIDFMYQDIEKRNFFSGPLQYCSIEEGKKIVEEFLAKYLTKYLKEYQTDLSNHIFVYSKEELYRYIHYLETGDENCYSFDELENVLASFSLCLEEAKELMRCRGNYTNFFDDYLIHIVSDEDYSTPMELIHEYLHKIYDNYHELETVEDDILTEACSYFGEFLMRDFLTEKISNLETELAFQKIPIILEGDLLLSKFCKSIYEKKKTLLEDEKLKKIIENVEEDYFPPADFIHPFGFLLAYNWYEEVEGKSLFFKCQFLDKKLKYPYDDLKDGKVYIRKIMNYRKRK